MFLCKSGIFVFKSVLYIFQFTSLDLHMIPGGFRSLPSGFSYVPDVKFTRRSHPGKFLKIFSGKSSSPHRRTETGCIDDVSTNSPLSQLEFVLHKITISLKFMSYINSDLPVPAKKLQTQCNVTNVINSSQIKSI